MIPIAQKNDFLQATWSKSAGFENVGLGGAPPGQTHYRRHQRLRHPLRHVSGAVPRFSYRRDLFLTRDTLCGETFSRLTTTVMSITDRIPPMAWRRCFNLVQHSFAKPITFKCLAALAPGCGNWHYSCSWLSCREAVSIRTANQYTRARTL